MEGLLKDARKQLKDTQMRATWILDLGLIEYAEDFFGLDIARVLSDSRMS